MKEKIDLNIKDNRNRLHFWTLAEMDVLMLSNQFKYNIETFLVIFKHYEVIQLHAYCRK